MEDQKPKCSNHPDKESAFYCFKHLTFVCLRCVSVHVQCQVENQFQPLEEIFDTLQNDLNKEEEMITQKLTHHASQLDSNNEKMTTLGGLKNYDIKAIEDFFEELKKKAEDIKLKVVQNYETQFTSILEKVVSNNTSITNTLERENEHYSKVQKLQKALQEAETVTEKRARAVELWREFEKVKLESVESAKLQVIDHEIEFLMGREEVFSEVGNLTLLYNNIQSKVAEFLNEKMSDYVRASEGTIRPKSNQYKEDFSETKQQETLDEKIKKIEYMQEDNQIYEENFLKAMEDKEEANKANTRLHQLRFCSNEVNVFDCSSGKFTCYELYTTNTYKTPFFIFNNCCSALHRNHLVFLFGGEDPALNDKSSNRVFCFNLDHATIDRKVVVYEISPMANARQEFTLSTIGNSIYVISGYDSNKNKEYRVIPKCERLDIKSKSFCDMRDINYPRQSACSINVNDSHIYCFSGQNPKYLNFFVDKIERYTLKLNDWSVVKYSVMNEFTFEPGTNSTAFRLNDSEIIILGGQREFDELNGFYVFDMRKLLFVKKEENFFEEADNFYNQNDVEADKDGVIKVFSSNMTNHVYQIKVKDASTYSLFVEVISDQDS